MVTKKTGEKKKEKKKKRKKKKKESERDGVRGPEYFLKKKEKNK